MESEDQSEPERPEPLNSSLSVEESFSTPRSPSGLCIVTDDEASRSRSRPKSRPKPRGESQIEGQKRPASSGPSSPPMKKKLKLDEVVNPENVEDGDLLEGKVTVPVKSLIKMDKDMTDKASQENLTRRNVKSILHHVLTNKMVLTMVKKSLRDQGEWDSDNEDSEDDESVLVWEPKLTRARAKELMKGKEALEGEVRVVGKDEDSTTALLTNEYPEDETDDEEYQPNPEQDQSDEETQSIISSCIASDIGSPVVMTPRSTATDEPSQEAVFREPQSSFRKCLDFQSSFNQEWIGLRTRSKFPLQDTSLETLERSFVPPDISADMYESGLEEEDEEWKNFLREYALTSYEARREESQETEEEDDDPEYNFLEEEGQEDPDPEEVRNDRAVKVPKKELTELWKELMEDPYFRTSPINGDEEDDNEKEVETQTKSKDKEKEASFRSKEKQISSSEDSSDGKERHTMPKESRVGKEKKGENEEEEEEEDEEDEDEEDEDMEREESTEGSDEEDGSDVEAGGCIDDGMPPLDSVIFTSQQLTVLEVQLRQHVQLLCQTFLISSLSDSTCPTTNAARSHLMELSSFAASRKENASSIYHIRNLEPAVQLVKDWKLPSVLPKVLAPQKKRRRINAKGRLRLPLELAQTMSTSKAFLYPSLLPAFRVNPLSSSATRAFLPAEDNLIALGLSEFVPFVEREGLCSKGSELDAALPFVRRFLLPSRTVRQLRLRIKNLCTRPGNCNNSVKCFLENGRVPVLRTPLQSMGSKELSPLYLHPLASFPRIWRPHIVQEKRVNGLIRPKPAVGEPGSMKMPALVARVIVTPPKSLPVGTSASEPPSIPSPHNWISPAKTVSPILKKYRRQTRSRTRAQAARSLIFNLPPICPRPAESSSQLNNPANSPVQRIIIPCITIRMQQSEKAEPVATLSVPKNFPSMPIISMATPVKDQGSLCLQNIVNQTIATPGSKLLLTESQNTPSSEQVTPSTSIVTQEPDLADKSRKGTADEQSLSQEERDALQPEKETDLVHENMAALMKASMVISTPKTLKSCKKKASVRQVREAKTTMEILNKTMDPAHQEEKEAVIAEAYYDKLRTNLDRLAMKELQDAILQFETGSRSVRDIYREVQRVLRPHPDLLYEFAAFLTPEQAMECGVYQDLLFLNRVHSFLVSLHVMFASQPSHLHKISKTLMQAKKACASDEQLKKAVLPLLKGNQYLIEEFLLLLPKEKPPERLLTDYEDLPLSFDNEGNAVEMPEPRGYEILKLPPQVYEDKYGGLDCPCKCHECDIKRYQLRLEHCVPCGIRFVDGKVCLKSDKKLKALDADDMRCILACHTSPSDEARGRKRASKSNILGPDVLPSEEVPACGKKDRTPGKKDREWSRNEDMIILSTCKEKGISEASLQHALAALHGRSLEEVKKRMEDLLQALELASSESNQSDASAIGLPLRDQPSARILSLGGAPIRDHSDLGASLSPPPPGWHSPSETGRVCVARRALPCLFRPFPAVSIVRADSIYRELQVEMKQMPTGKAVPAFGFLAVGLLMTWDTLARWHRSRLDPAAARYRNSLRFVPGRLPWEYIFIACVCLVGLIGELYFHRGLGLMGLKHAGSYLGFLFLSCVLFAKELRLETLPPNSDYAAFILALSLQYILLAFNHAQSLLDDMTVAALRYVILTGIVATSLEMLKPHHVMAGLFRCYAVFLQGTWYSQMAVIFSQRHSGWDFEKRENVTIATVSFTLQVVLDAVFILVLSFIMGKCQKTKTFRFSAVKSTESQVAAHYPLKMARPMDGVLNQKSPIEFLTKENVTLEIIHLRLQNAYGTWYSQMAVIFSQRHSGWDFEKRENVTIATVSFTLQVVLDAVFIFVLSFIMGKCQKSKTFRFSAVKSTESQ
ncbi:unnamed protein product, partial [Darwinula stevensoni]